MDRFQPVLPLIKTNITRRRGRTWRILGLVVFLFLALTIIAVRYLPTVVIDPVSVLKNDFGVIFAPPIPRPPINWPHQDHNHSLHLSDDRSRLIDKINRNKDNLINLDDNNNNNNNDGDNKNLNNNNPQTNLKNLSTSNNMLSVENLTQIFSHMSIEELQKLQSVEMRREKVREVSWVYSFLFVFFFVLKSI